MKTRLLTSADWPRVVELHEKGITPSNELPALDHPLVLVKDGVVDMNRLVAAAIARLELNVTLVLDHDWATPQERLTALHALQDSMYAKASAYGLDWAYAEAGPRFGTRLEGMGWTPAKNGLYFLRIH